MLQELSQRELQVIAMLADGALNKQVASTLNLSLRTVETYRNRISKKLGAVSSADIVAFAVTAGLRRKPMAQGNFAT